MNDSQLSERLSRMEALCREILSRLGDTVTEDGKIAARALLERLESLEREVSALREAKEPEAGVDEAAEAALRERAERLFRRFRDPETDELTEEGEALLENAWMNDGIGGAPR